MHQLGTHENTSKRNKNRSLNKQNKSKKINKFTHIYYRINNVNEKNDNNNDHGQPYWFKETQIVAYKFDTVAKNSQRKSISLFSI